MSPRYSGTKVLLVATLDEVQNAHNALLRRALERHGCAVLHLDPDQAGWLERLARRAPEARLARALDQHRPDLVIVAGMPGPSPEQIVELKIRQPARWVNWFPGDMQVSALAIRTGQAFDRVYVSGTDVATELVAAGIRQAVYLPFGCDPSVHKPLRARGPFRANVVFAGTASPEREELFTELIEYGLALWGESWRKTSLRDYCRGALPSLEDYVRASAGATVAVNVHAAYIPNSAPKGRGCNRRVFELAAIGVAQVVDHRDDLAQHFEDGTEVLVFSNPTELKGQVKRALQNDSYRERVAAAARQRAISAHTYMHRVSKLLDDALPSRGGPSA
jgi:spore maturation protein CgeB